MRIGPAGRMPVRAVDAFAHGCIERTCRIAEVVRATQPRERRRRVRPQPAAAKHFVELGEVDVDHEQRDS